MAQGVSEYVRGFSFMSESKVDVIDLQYIEGGELSRAWKMSRRERLKNIEAKIWDEFINERDIVDSVSSENPYQFLEKLPEDCIREVLDTELTIMQKEMVEDSGETAVEPVKAKEDAFKDLQEPRETMVTFAEALEDEQCDMITILDDEEVSEGGEREEGNESMESPCTVRDARAASPAGLAGPAGPAHARPDRAGREAKSPENMTTMIETSIYSAKVKELQSKVNLELLAVITTLEVQNLSQLDPNSIPKLQKQCGEFCSRYCRIYLYPITRQIHDITRHNNSATPFARHTHTRSQMIRAVSLQQNMFQSLQMFHKWVTQKTPLRECAHTLKNFIQLVQEADSVCPAEIHNGELLQTCESLNVVLGQYLTKLNNYIGDENATNGAASRSGKSSRSMKKRAIEQLNKQGKSKPGAEAKLSMYSLDRFHRHSKSSIGRSSGGTSKARMAGEAAADKPDEASPAHIPAPSKKTRSRRPLMRAPGGGPRRAPPDHENITTLVEAVDIVSSPRASAANSVVQPSAASTPRSPRRPRHPREPRSNRGIRKKDASPTKSPKISPRRKKLLSEKELKLALDIHDSEDSLPSVIKVQCAKKDSPVVKTPTEVSPTEKTEEWKERCAKKDSPVVKTLTEETPREKTEERKEREDVASTSDVSVLLRRLCAGQSASKLRSPRDRTSGSKNAQLLCVNGGSPRGPALGTPQLLRILEETIQKQAPKPLFCTKPPVKDVDRFRLSFNRTGTAAEALFQYRTKFVQHMLSSPMYANSAVGKPWEMIGKISENIIDEILLACAKEMQLENIVDELYKSETR